MALVNCSECGGNVSTKAAACPHCGAPVVGIPGADEGREAADGASATLGALPAPHPVASKRDVVASDDGERRPPRDRAPRRSRRTLVLLGIWGTVAVVAFAVMWPTRGGLPSGAPAPTAAPSTATQQEPTIQDKRKFGHDLARRMTAEERLVAIRQAAQRVSPCANTFSGGEQIGAIVDAAADEREAATLRLAADEVKRGCWGHAAFAAAQGAHDGSEIDRAYVEVAVAVGHVGVADLKRMAGTTRAEAMKDPQSVRGRVVDARGTVVQIRKERDESSTWSGTLLAEDGFIYFIARGDTGGIVDGASATFVGVMLQRFTYSNLAGGQTESVVLVGQFDLPQNTRAESQVELEADLAAAKRPRPAGRPASPPGAVVRPNDAPSAAPPSRSTASPMPAAPF